LSRLVGTNFVPTKCVIWRGLLTCSAVMVPLDRGDVIAARQGDKPPSGNRRPLCSEDPESEPVGAIIEAGYSSVRIRWDDNHPPSIVVSERLAPAGGALMTITEIQTMHAMLLALEDAAQALENWRQARRYLPGEFVASRPLSAWPAGVASDHLRSLQRFAEATALAHKAILQRPHERVAEVMEQYSCPNCDGSGEVARHSGTAETVPCPACMGRR
jgi:hypothetical protein